MFPLEVRGICQPVYEPFGLLRRCRELDGRTSYTVENVPSWCCCRHVGPAVDWPGRWQAFSFARACYWSEMSICWGLGMLTQAYGRASLGHSLQA